MNNTQPDMVYSQTMKRYNVTDGKIILTLEEAEEGGFVVTSPIDPAVITQAETISEAFENARDAMAVLKAARRDIRRKLQPSRVSRPRQKV
jgi:predicted RNase H-like HicB family nuclease